ncbi:MAG: penicillin acylase family protein [Bacteroidia bacterium]
MRAALRVSLWVGVVLLLELGLGRRWGRIPPLGRFFSPVEGFWRNAEPKTARPPAHVSIPTLEDTVRIIWDNRWVPHIFARNERDLYRVQGYLQAYLRLWQMEIQADFAAGRLSRILGGRTLEQDRAMRRLGIPYAAEKVVEVLRKDSTLRAVVEALTEGINAYIQQLSPRDYPIEYKLLDYAPEPWSVYRSALLVKYMAYDLTTRSHDKYLTRLLRQYGREVIDSLYPNFAPIGHTTILEERSYPQQEVPPQAEQPFSQAYMEDTLAQALEEGAQPGSNNWALSGTRTASGYPLLANDPHLALTLPSIWLEMHLVAPGLNVYGVTLMGAPGIIIGYNEAVAWGVTNVGPDAMDYYHLTYADTAQESFLFGKEVLHLQPRVETLYVRTFWGGQRQVLDTVWYTPWGPVVHRRRDRVPRPLAGKAREAPMDCALRWISYEPSNEARFFYLINRARNLEDYKAALRVYGSPAQNFAYADTAGHIALWVRGLYPLRWPNQGKFVLDAANPAHHWRDWLPLEANPHAIDPPSGFVRSANSHPAPKSYPYYLGWDFDVLDRAARIAQRLQTMRQATVDSLRLLQLDTRNYLASEALPLMLESLKDQQGRWLDTLRQWDYHFRAEATAPTLFRRWWELFHRTLWKPLALRPPEWEITLKLLRDIAAGQVSSFYQRWFKTDSVAKAVRDTLQRTWREVAAWAEKAGDTLTWWRYRGTRIRHLAQLPGFGTEVLRLDGDDHCINSIRPTSGPSWRMVVDLKPPVQGYGVYPGGQSGNPGSWQYMSFIPTWAAGQLYKHYFGRTPAAIPPEAVLQTTYLYPNQ